MTEQGGFPLDETAPIAASSAVVPPALPTESAGPPSDGLSATEVLAVPSVSALVGQPAGPAATTPAGWYPLNGEQRYWDGFRWTEHRAPAPVYRPAYYAPVIVTDARTNGAEVAIAWIVTVLSIGYMLPWAIAASRGKSNSWAVGLVNFLLGWTLIGWVAALVMACTSHQVAVVHHRG